MPTTTTRLGLAKPATTDAATEYRTAITGNATTLDNAAIYLQGTLVSIPAAGIAGRYYLATDDTRSGSPTGSLYFDTGAAWVGPWNPASRGSSVIATSESRTNTAYGTLTTPDQVAGIVLPTNGLITVWYQATWQESVNAAARAAVFIGANQLKMWDDNTGTVAVQEATGGGVNSNVALATNAGGLQGSNQNVYPGDVSTGQVVGFRPFSAVAAGGPCYIFAAAGTYTISVQFKASSGTVTASSRKLWVEAKSFA